MNPYGFHITRMGGIYWNMNQYGGFLKWGYSQIIQFMRNVHYKLINHPFGGIPILETTILTPIWIQLYLLKGSVTGVWFWRLCTFSDSVWIHREPTNFTKMSNRSIIQIWWNILSNTCLFTWLCRNADPLAGSCFPSNGSFHIYIYIYNQCYNPQKNQRMSIHLSNMIQNEPICVCEREYFVLCRVSKFLLASRRIGWWENLQQIHLLFGCKNRGFL